MGNNKSRHRNANTRAATTATRVAATNATAAIIASSPPISTSHIVQHDERIQQVLAVPLAEHELIGAVDMHLRWVASLAQKQIGRGGDTLTKDDMIAIVFILKTIVKRNSRIDRSDMAESFRREDLVASIRTIVFDPSTIQSILEIITEPEPTPAPPSYATGIHEAHDEIFISELGVDLPAERLQ